MTERAAKQRRSLHTWLALCFLRRAESAQAGYLGFHCRRCTSGKPALLSDQTRGGPQRARTTCGAQATTVRTYITADNSIFVRFTAYSRGHRSYCSLRGEPARFNCVNKLLSPAGVALPQFWRVSRRGRPAFQQREKQVLHYFWRVDCG
jgi:hypothetical protein